MLAATKKRSLKLMTCFYGFRIGVRDINSMLYGIVKRFDNHIKRELLTFFEHSCI